MLSPDRNDPMQSMTGAKGPGGNQLPVKRSYYDIMTEQSLENERADVYRKIH